MVTAKQIAALAAMAPMTTQVSRNGSTPSAAELGSGDYRTLDVVAWFRAHDLYGKPGNEAGKHNVACPWSAEHSDNRDAEDSDTVVWEAAGDQWPRFHCSHAHCAGRRLEDVMRLLGDADRFCSKEFAPEGAEQISVEDLNSDEGTSLAALNQDYEPEGKRKRDIEERASLQDFYAYLPEHKYIYVPTRDLWPASSVNSQIPSISTGERDEDGKLIKEPANKWLDREKPVQQMTWAPGYPLLIKGQYVVEGGWKARPGMSVFNQYEAPELLDGDPKDIALWWHHIVRLYGQEQAEHLVKWFAHRVQRPGEKVNHALVLSGSQGIGKDTILEPVKAAVGAWNWAEVSPIEILGRFNSFRKSVVIRISEARDMGDIDRYGFYEHLKIYTAAPPDTLRVDEKNRQEYMVPNVCGVILTTNHLQSGIFLPPDDRRHYVVQSHLVKEDFSADYWRELWGWYDNGGRANVAAYLRILDLSDFDPKMPPPRTEAFYTIVNAHRADEEEELERILNYLGTPAALIKDQISEAAYSLQLQEFKTWLEDRRNSKKLNHRLEDSGYTPVLCIGSKDGRWAIPGAARKITIYGDKRMSERDRQQSAAALLAQLND